MCCSLCWWIIMNVGSRNLDSTTVMVSCSSMITKAASSENAYLNSKCYPGFASVLKFTMNIIVIHWHIGLSCESATFLQICSEASKSRGCPTDLSVNIFVKTHIVTHCILSMWTQSYLLFLRLIVSPKCAIVFRSIKDWMCDGMCTATGASSANKIYLIIVLLRPSSCFQTRDVEHFAVG